MSPKDFDRIRRENDRFRQSLNDADVILWQADLVRRGSDFRDAVLRTIREQSNFEGDVVGLHDWGTVVVDNQSIEWTLAYLDRNAEAAPPDLANRRVMVIASSR